MKFLNIKNLAVLICVITGFSCSKDNGSFSWTSEARYLVTITGKWSSPSFTVPPGAHFTTFVGMVHNNQSVLFKEGNLASPGMELLAEMGNGTTLLTEIDAAIATGKASSLLLFTAPDLTGSKTFSVYANSNFSQVSFASMLGPTPDWFMGVSGISLYNQNKWITDTTVNLYAFDAGTEDGNVFDYNNAATVPQQNITILKASNASVLANGNSSLVPIATARFLKQ